MNRQVILTIAKSRIENRLQRATCSVLGQEYEVMSHEGVPPVNWSKYNESFQEACRPRRLEDVEEETSQSGADREETSGSRSPSERGEVSKHVCQALEESEATYQRWLNQHSGMNCEEAKRLKELEIEHARLKKLLAAAELDKAMLNDIAEENF